MLFSVRRRLAMATDPSAHQRFVLVQTNKDNFYVGNTLDTHVEIAARGAVRLRHCRVLHYQGAAKGAFAAVHGLCNKTFNVSAAVPGETTILDVSAVFECTPEAVASFAARNV